MVGPMAGSQGASIPLYWQLFELRHNLHAFEKGIELTLYKEGNNPDETNAEYTVLNRMAVVRLVMLQVVATTIILTREHFKHCHKEFSAHSLNAIAIYDHA